MGFIYPTQLCPPQTHPFNTPTNVQGPSIQKKLDEHNIKIMFMCMLYIIIGKAK